MYEYILREYADYLNVKYETLLSEHHVICEANEENDKKYGSYIPVKIMSFSNAPSLNDGTLIISVYPSYREVIENYYNKFKSGIFDDEALLSLNENLKNPILAEGYVNKNNPLNHSYVYAQNKIERLNLNKIKENTVKIVPENAYSNLTAFNFNKWFGKDQICYGTVIDNEIVSYAALNYPPEKKTASIGVGTIQRERCKGYALSNTVAVAKELIDNGNEVSYSCRYTNIPSQHIAKGAGFEFIAKIFGIYWEHI